MENIKEKSTYLCGGVLFFLITQTTYSKPTAKERMNGISSDHSEPEIMADLAEILLGNRPDSKKENFHTDVSYYKECKKTYSKNLPFHQSSLCQPYKNMPKGEYKKIVEDMEHFIKKHINPTMKEWLIKVLLHIIKNDPQINDTDPFYITDSNIPKSKADLLRMTDFKSSYFLVGIMHYILMRRTISATSEDLKNGQLTLDLLGDKPYRRPRIKKDLSDLTADYTIQVDVKNNILADLILSGEKLPGYTLRNVSIEILEEFKNDFDIIISLFTETDFESTLFPADLDDYLNHLCKFKWDNESQFILHADIKTLMYDTMSTLLQFSKFLSPQYMHKRKTDTGDVLIIKNTSAEEQEHWQKVVRPEIQLLRSELKRQYSEICKKISHYTDNIEPTES